MFLGKIKDTFTCNDENDIYPMYIYRGRGRRKVIESLFLSDNGNVCFNNTYVINS